MDHEPSENSLIDLQCFDSSQDYSIEWKRLPHWAQAGTICFITWRTADSFPREVAARLHRYKLELMKNNQLDLSLEWRDAVKKLPPATRARLRWQLFTNWDEKLDCSAGACVLARPEFSKIVIDSLLYFDNDRYVLTDAVVMPNHVHLLVAFREGAIHSLRVLRGDFCGGFRDFHGSCGFALT